MRNTVSVIKRDDSVIRFDQLELGEFFSNGKDLFIKINTDQYVHADTHNIGSGSSDWEVKRVKVAITYSLL